MNLTIKDIQVTSDALHGIDRQITKINFYFDFYSKEQTYTHALLNKIYPDW